MRRRFIVFILAAIMTATLGAMARLPKDATLDVPEPLDDKGGIMLSYWRPWFNRNGYA